MRVDSFVREREGKPGIGMIEQSLCHHLQTQLTEYYRLIAVLESQMSSGASSEDSADGTTSQGTDPQIEESGLTLKRLDVWIQEWRLRMRMMSVCVEGARGQLLLIVSADYFTQFPCLRRTRRSSGESHTRLCRQRRPVRAEVHRPAARGSETTSAVTFVYLIDTRGRSPIHSLPRSTNGSSQGSSTILSRSSSLQLTPNLHTSNTYNSLPAVSSPVTAALAAWAEKPRTSRGSATAA